MTWTYIGETAEIEDSNTTEPKSDPRKAYLVRIGDLQIDHLIQRPVTKEGWKTIQKIIDIGWVPALSGGITVRKKNGVLLVIIGQHRVIAGQKIDPDMLVWVFEIDATDQEAAALSRGETTVRTNHSPLAIWNLDLLGGSDLEVAATRWLSVRGITVGKAPHGFNNICAISTLRMILEGSKREPRDEWRGMQQLKNVILISTTLWGVDDGLSDDRFDANILRALDRVLWTNRARVVDGKKVPGLKLDRIVERLKLAAWTPKTAVNLANNHTPGVSASDYLAEAIVNQYNKFLKTGKIL